MSVIVCLSLESRTEARTEARPETRTEVAAWYSLVLDERRFSPRAVLDESSRRQPRTLSLTTGVQRCQRLGFSVQETTDYGRPIAVVLETGLQDKEEGPVLDPDWPNTVRAELPFWNGCEQEDSCVPDLILHSHTDLLSLHQFCSSGEGPLWSVCGHQRAADEQRYVVEAGRRRLVVFARLENQGENAYGAAVHISASSNLIFSSLIVKDQSDIQFECHSDYRLSTRRSCNISAPFMKSLSQVSFNVEFELSRSVFLDHIRVVIETTSEGDEGFPDDNINDIFLPLKYQTEVLFTRDTNPPRFEIRPDSLSSSSRDKTNSSLHTFDLTFYLQNLGLFPVENLLFRADVWSVTPQRNQLIRVLDYSLEQASGSCSMPQNISTNQIKEEDLSRLTQLNHSNSGSVAVQCRLTLPTSREVKITVRGRLNTSALLAVSFKSLELLATASIHLEPSSPMFLQEDRPVRQIVLELRKEEDHSVPFWIIVGSSLGGLLLLALLVLALWKLGFFNRRRRKEEDEEPVAKGKTAEEL